MTTWRGKAADDGKGIPFVDLRKDSCRWPLGEYRRKASMYCGVKVEEEKRSYCNHHHKLAYTPARMMTRKT